MQQPQTHGFCYYPHGWGRDSQRCSELVQVRRAQNRDRETQSQNSMTVSILFHHVPIWADIGLLRWKLVSAFSLDCISQTFIGDTEPALTNYSLETLRICLKLEEFSNNGSSELFKVRAGRIMDMQISKGEACIWGKGNEMFKNSNGISHQWFKCWNLSLALR